MEKQTLFTGKDIRNSNTDILQAVSLHGLYKRITEPDEGLIGLGIQLSKVISIDEKAYHKLKTRLPYFIGATFENGLRKTENFCEINWVIVDIDKCFHSLEKEAELKEMFRKDARVSLLFTSPSNQGLKLLFRLESPMTNSSLYTNFYKAFTAELARHYKLEKYMDFKTSDVTRVSFLSTDANAWMNEDALPVSWKDYLSQYDLINNHPGGTEKIAGETNGSNNLRDDVYAKILRKLNPKTPKRPKNVFVPKALHQIVNPVTTLANKMGLTLAEIIDIQYGKKFVFRNGPDFAYINVFYGKNGFTVVITPKRGHSPKLSEAAKAVVEEAIFSNHEQQADTLDKPGTPETDSLKNIQLN